VGESSESLSMTSSYPVGEDAAGGLPHGVLHSP
jgi:hypothetical protein